MTTCIVNMDRQLKWNCKVLVASLTLFCTGDNLYSTAMIVTLFYMQLSGFQNRKKKQIQNRWLVAYTLVHNPCLCQLRASNLRAEENVKDDVKGDVEV